MADQPSRALVIYGDGLMSCLGPSHSHIHSLASAGCCGFLALRDLPPQASEEERELRELAQLIDTYDFYAKEFNSNDPEHEKWGTKQLPEIPKLEERFMGMKALMLTDSCVTTAFGKNAGFHVQSLNELLGVTELEDPRQLPDPCLAASKLLSMLGIKTSTSTVTNALDLVFLHFHSNLIKTNGNDCNDTSKANILNWINSCIGAVLDTLHSNTEEASRLHLSAVLSYGMVSSNSNDAGLRKPLSNLSQKLSVLNPCQSYMMKEGKELNHIRLHHPMLIAQFQKGVTRMDEAKAFSFEEFQGHGGNLAILADRFLYEVAFKLWKAPKYGA